LLGVVVTAAGALVWALFLSRTGTDLSAQIARAEFAGAYPSSAYDFSWYGGIPPAGYSILAPYLFAAFGTRQATSVAAVLCGGLLALLLVRHRVARPRAAVLWVAVAVWTGLVAGQATFIVGVSAALGCVAVIDGSRWPRAMHWSAVVVLAAVSSMVSPVAGLFLGVAAAAFFLIGRRADGIVIGVAAGAPLAISAYLSVGGVQPIDAHSAVPSLLGAIFVFLAVPRRVVRIGAAIYGLGAIVAWVVPTPVGSNVERLGLLLAGPLLAGMGMTRTRRARPLLAIALGGIAIWQLAAPVRDVAGGSAPRMHDPDTVALRQELHALHADTARVEAVPEYGHWESAELAGTVQLARGWERQIDATRNPLFYQPTLTAAAYHQWLRINAVRYVVLAPNTKPDYAAVTETAIVRAGQPWLVPIWRNTSWQLYQVLDSQPLASPPATILNAGPATITITMPQPASSIVRVYYSKLLQVSGDAIITQAGRWTRLTAYRPGNYVLSGSY
jgi:hypothetical protein